MKKATLITIIILTSSIVYSQNTYVPDDNFEQALIDLGYDDVMDDYVLTSNISDIQSLNVNAKEILDLTGIEDFSALSNFYCSDNQLTDLDISANTNLTELRCDINQLTSLDVSANTSLAYFGCSSNQLTSIDVSANIALSFFWCGNNQLTSLDLSTNTALYFLYCSENHLTSLDVSANTNLTYLYCDNNQLTSLDVSANIILSEIVCDLNQLTSLNVSANAALINLDCSDNQLSNLYITANTALETLYCDHNQLSNLDVSVNTNLEELRCQYNQLSFLDVSANTALKYLFCYMNQFISLDIRNGSNAEIIYFNSSENPDLKCIYVDDKDASYLSGWIIDPSSSFVETEAECDAIYVKDITDSQNIFIYPNPIRNYFKINIDDEILSINIYDLLGRKIKTYYTQECYSLEDINKGIYFIEIELINIRIVSKIITE